MSTVTESRITPEIRENKSVNNPIKLLPLYHPNLEFLLKINHHYLQRCFYNYVSNQKDYEGNNSFKSLKTCKYECNGDNNNSCRNYISMGDVLEGRCIWNFQARKIKQRGEELDELRNLCYGCNKCLREDHKVCYEDIRDTIRYEEVLGTLGLRKLSF